MSSIAFFQPSITFFLSEKGVSLSRKKHFLGYQFAKITFLTASTIALAETIYNFSLTTFYLIRSFWKKDRNSSTLKNYRWNKTKGVVTGFYFSLVGIFSPEKALLKIKCLEKNLKNKSKRLTKKTFYQFVDLTRESYRRRYQKALKEKRALCETRLYDEVANRLNLNLYQELNQIPILTSQNRSKLFFLYQKQVKQHLYLLDEYIKQIDPEKHKTQEKKALCPPILLSEVTPFFLAHANNLQKLSFAYLKEKSCRMDANLFSQVQQELLLYLNQRIEEIKKSNTPEDAYYQFYLDFKSICEVIDKKALGEQTPFPNIVPLYQKVLSYVFNFFSQIKLPKAPLLDKINAI